MKNGPYQCAELMIYRPVRCIFNVVSGPGSDYFIIIHESLRCSNVLYCSCRIKAESCISNFGDFPSFSYQLMDYMLHYRLENILLPLILCENAMKFNTRQLLKS